jgi:hypothetical protein
MYLTNTAEVSTTREAISHETTLELTKILSNPKVYYPIHKTHQLCLS